MKADKKRRQCAKCPWKVCVDPHDIPCDYSARKHAALINTIATPGQLNIGPILRIMACHEQPTGKELPCVGWLDNQYNEGNNLAVRLAVVQGKLSANYELDGPQHKTFEDTLPKCAYCKRPHLVSKRARDENPFCAACLHERMEKATAGKKVSISVDGDYVVATLEPSSVRNRDEAQTIARAKRKSKR